MRELHRITVLLAATFALAMGCADHEDDEGSDGRAVCQSFDDIPEWITWSAFSSFDAFHNAMEPGEVYIIATVELTAAGFRLMKNSFEVEATWNGGVDLPVVDGQTVYLWWRTGAGDDGCCDTQATYIYDQNFRLLIADVWNTMLTDMSVGGEVLSADSQTVATCQYEEGGQPRSSEVNWLEIEGLGVSGDVDGSTFDIPGPGRTRSTSDNLFAVHWPVGYTGTIIDDEGVEWWSMNTKLEIVATP